MTTKFYRFLIQEQVYSLTVALGPPMLVNQLVFVKWRGLNSVNWSAGPRWQTGPLHEEPL